jgi:hypothetical protein
MADFDDAERHAIQEVEPADQVAWLLEEVDPDLAFFGWLQTQVAPPPGVPQLRCDCVAGLRSLSGTQPPWACLIEAQAQPLAGMAVWMMIYLGLLHNVLRFDGRDPFQMMGVILELSEGELSHTVLWPVPLRKKTPEAAAAGADAGQPASVAAPGPAPGITCVFFVKNVRQESAEKTLERIDRKELGLCILVWVPLMAGADDPNIVRRWRDLALRQKQLHLLADYVALALVFAEMAGLERQRLWETELEGFNVQESTVMRKWRKDGVDEGVQKGTLTTARADVVKVLQARFPEVPVPEGVRSALEKNTDVQQLGDWLCQAAVTASPADFERFLTTPRH